MLPVVPDVALLDVVPELPLVEPEVLFSELTEPPVVPVTPLDVALVPVVELVPEVELLEVPVVLETIWNAPSIDTLAVFWSSICWWTSIFCTSRPVPSIVTFAVVPAAGSRLKVCEKLLPDDLVVVPATPPVVLVPLAGELPLDVVPLEPPVELLPAPDVELSELVELFEVLLPVTAFCKDLPAFCNEF